MSQLVRKRKDGKSKGAKVKRVAGFRQVKAIRVKRKRKRR